MPIWIVGAGEEMTQSILPPPTSRSRYIPIAINYFLVAAMQACFTVTLVRFFQAFAGEWNGSYLIGITFFITLEALLSQRLHSVETILSRDWILQYVTELIILFLAIKIYLILRHASGTDWSNPAYWANAFQADIFDGETLISSLYAFLIWMLGSRYSAYLRKLEEDPELMVHQKMGLVQSDTDEVRRQLLSLIFGMGAVMLTITALVRMDLSAIGIHLNSIPSRAWPLILYFVFGFAILAQTRYSTLRIRWYLDSISTGSNLAIRWAGYSLLLFFTVGLVSLLLPTSYSLNLLDTLHVILTGIILVFNFIFGLLVAPFLLLFQWVSALFPTSNSLPLPQPTLPPIHNPPPLPGTSGLTADLLRSVLYWGIFLTVVAFSILYYMRSRSGYAHFVRNLGLAQWLKQVWNWITLRFTRINRAILNSVRATRNRLRPAKALSSSRRWLFQRVGPLQPRNRVRQLYVDMLQQAAEKGIPRKASQTPYEYAQSMHDSLPGISPEVDELTDGFMEARYSSHEISEQEASLLQQLWARIRSALLRQPHKRPL